MQASITQSRFLSTPMRFDTSQRVCVNSGMAITLGKRLKHEREAQGLTQDQLAEAIGVKQSVITSIETRSQRSSVHAPALAKALKVNVDWLLSGTDPKEIEYQVSKIPCIKETVHTYEVESIVAPNRIPSDLVRLARLLNTLTQEDRRQLLRITEAAAANLGKDDVSDLNEGGELLANKTD